MKELVDISTGMAIPQVDRLDEDVHSNGVTKSETSTMVFLRVVHTDRNTIKFM
jgi:hypothetical protein